MFTTSGLSDFQNYNKNPWSSAKSVSSLPTGRQACSIPDFHYLCPMQKLSMDQLQRPSVEAFRAQAKLPVTLVLDNVRSMHNVGSAFRTSDAFAVERIILCGITGTPPHREIEKTALGATQSVAWEHTADTAAAVGQLREDGYRILAVEQAKGSIPLQEFTPEVGGKYALVFGNEVHGVADEVVALADMSLEIPQSGSKHSLNIAVSVGIVLWEFYRNHSHGPKKQ